MLEVLLALTVGLPAIYLLYWLWFVPLNRVRGADDVGYASRPEVGQRKREWINRVRRARRKGEEPQDYPNGWFVVAESRELPPGKVVHVSALGLNLAVYRGNDDNKEVYVVDAYCPHLGANMALGGSVDGDCIKCPFHEWKFNGETGKCKEIPYMKEGGKIPDFARVPTHQCLEFNGLVYLWYHRDNEPPTWTPERLEQLNSPQNQWRYQGRNEYEVSCHIQDIPENGADIAHLPAIHKTSIFSGGEPTGSLFDRLLSLITWHEWNVKWSAETEEDRKHRAIVNLRHTMKVGPSGWNALTLDVCCHQIGPSLVNLHFSSGVMGEGVMLQYVLPLEPMLQKIVHIFYTDYKWPPPLAKLTLYGESNLLERDIAVWNSKSYLSRPLLVKEDNLILKHRRWYSQFYSDGKQKKQNYEW